MSYLWPAGLAQYYSDDIEAKGTILYVVRGEKILRRPEQFCSLGLRDGFLGRAEGLIGSGSDLDKDDGAIGIDEDKVDFARFA
jgi:hypothetical protein